jgi:hypothetical protein
MDIDDDDDDYFDDRDLIELVKLAGYLEGKAARGLFPKARFQRYSDTLDRLLEFLAEGELDLERRAVVKDVVKKRFAPFPLHDPAKILTHPRFRGRRIPDGQ